MSSFRPASGTQDTSLVALTQQGSCLASWPLSTCSYPTILKKHTEPHIDQTALILFLQFPVVQNAAAVVFQGEAEWGWPSLQLGATPEPCAASVGTHSAEAPMPPLVTLYCP